MMKYSIVRISIILILCVLFLFLPGCRLQETEEIEVIDYDTRTIEYWTDIDSGDAEELQPVRIKIYDSTGYQIGEFVDTYGDNQLKTRTDVYDVSRDGVKTLKEYFVFTYDTVNYNGEDIFRLIKGETFDPDDVRRLYYDQTYDANILDSYAERVTWAYEDGSDVKKSIRIRTYIKDVDPDLNGKYRTEQFYDYDTDQSTLILRKEYAAWHNGDGEITKELYHVKRGSQTEQVLPDVTGDESYFYVTYSRDTGGNVYLQNNFIYTDTGTDTDLDSGGDGSFNIPDRNLDDPFAFNPDPAGVEDQVDMLLTERDAEGNIESETLYSFGAVQEKTIYTYDSENRMTKKARYTQGGQVLDESTEIRYRDEYIDGTYYLVREVFTYQFNESYPVNREN